MTISFDLVHECAQVPVVVEGYSPKNGLAHGSLDVTVGVCDEHRQLVLAQINDCGMVPYSLQSVSDRKCGYRTTFEPNRYTETHKEKS